MGSGKDCSWGDEQGDSMVDEFVDSCLEWCTGCEFDGRSGVDSGDVGLDVFLSCITESEDVVT